MSDYKIISALNEEHKVYLVQSALSGTAMLFFGPVSELHPNNVKVIAVILSTRASKLVLFFMVKSSSVNCRTIIPSQYEYCSPRSGGKNIF